MTRHQITQKFSELGFNPEILKRYDEPHRFYHNWSHIESMLNQAEKNMEDYVLFSSNDLFLAIIFHDIVYDPKRQDNEAESAKLFRETAEKINYAGLKNRIDIMQSILDTKFHQSGSELSGTLRYLDLAILHRDFVTLIEFERNIALEYQWVDYSIYKQERTKVLEKLKVNPWLIQYVQSRKPNIAVYAGSFNPFTTGHLNILQKAEKIFDKVIIARGKNPEKNISVHPLPESLQYHQIEEYDGLLTDFLKSLKYDVTLIRGLRNGSDIQYENVQYRFMQEMMPNIKVVSIMCDKEFEHVSSSAVRQLEKYNAHEKYVVK